jgi:hypothetical protein
MHNRNASPQSRVHFRLARYRRLRARLQTGERTGGAGAAHGGFKVMSGVERRFEIAAECSPAPTASISLISSAGTETKPSRMAAIAPSLPSVTMMVLPLRLTNSVKQAKPGLNPCC